MDCNEDRIMTEKHVLMMGNHQKFFVQLHSCFETAVNRENYDIYNVENFVKSSIDSIL